MPQGLPTRTVGAQRARNVPHPERRGAGTCRRASRQKPSGGPALQVAIEEGGGNMEAAGGEFEDDLLALFGVGIEGESESGAQQALDGLCVQHSAQLRGVIGAAGKLLPDKQCVTVAAELERAEIGFGGLEARGGGNLRPGPIEDFALPDELRGGTNPFPVALGAGPASLTTALEGFCAVADGAAESLEFGWARGFHERVKEGFAENGAVEVAVEEAEIEESGVAEIFLGSW